MSEGPGSGVNIRLSSQVRVLARNNVLAHIARELFDAAGVSPETLNLVLDGFRRKLLKRVDLVMWNSKEVATRQVLAHMAIEIDWMRHAANVTSGSKTNEYSINPSIGVTGQVAPLLDFSRSYIKEVVRNLQIADWEVTYIFVDGNAPDSVKFKAEHNFRTMTTAEQQKLRAAIYDKDLKVTDHNLSELGLEFRYCQDPLKN